MSVVNVKPKTEGSSGAIRRDSKETTRVWTVLLDGTDPPELREAMVLEAATIPRRNDPHPVNADLRVDDVRADPISTDGTLYEVKVHYSTDTAGADGGLGGGAGGSSPDDEAAEVSFSTATSEEPVDEDVYGEAIQNTADEPYEIMRTFSDPVLTITHNRSSFSWSLIREYVLAVNTDVFWGWAAGTARIASINATLVRRGTARYWRVTFEIHFRADGWERRVLNRGFRELIVGDWRAIVDADGHPITEPALLDANGRQIASGGEGVWQQWELNPKKAFAPLKLSPQDLGL